ncbi:MAG: electron transfer flavoprotein subunit alpha/FixB family protein [Betaproteobacteria bacterium]|nr:electron transfer flavoprotein subunit alpha/FixB family protein [Betaproteobacteria bacterium]
MTAASTTLVIAELAQGRLSRLTAELLALARRLAAGTGDTVAAAVFANRADGVPEELIARGADHVYWMEHAQLEHYHGESWVSAAAQLCREQVPALVLAGHTAAGADLAPRLAFRLGTAVATGCVAVSLSGGRPVFTRPCFGGNARETLSFTTAPAVATLRAGCCEALARDDTRRGEVTRVVPQLDDETRRVTVVERLTDAVEGVQLEDAQIVIAGGRGLNGPDGFRWLEQLAGVLGGAVGASRVPCDLGWCPRSWQIGLTGRTVQPELYIAVGISGAGHHMAGCGGAKAIVAVNTDRDAAIFKDARFGVVGDYLQIVPAFIDELQKLRPPINADERR